MANHLMPSSEPATTLYTQVIEGAPDVDTLARARGALARLSEHPSANERAILSLLGKTSDLAEIEAIAQRWRKKSRDLFVIGSGGSGLSGKALAALTQHPFETGLAHTIQCADNLALYAVHTLLSRPDLDQACFFIVSKSGSTAETHAYAEALLADLTARRALSDLPECACIMTEATDNPMRRLAQRYSIPVIDHDPDLGGRFSILSPVGLLPAAYLDMDIQALRRGAGLVEPEEVARGAAFMHAQLVAGKNISVFMPYSERLWGLALWWRQCWAESLGKQGQGSTPYVSLGNADQHSQLQLYLDGPLDKSFTLLLPETRKIGPVLPMQASLEALRGRMVGDVLDAMQRATRETLVRKGRPVRSFHLPDISEETLGALLAHFMQEIMIMGELMGVNPFDQPAVEESKRLTREYLQ